MKTTNLARNIALFAVVLFSQNCAPPPKESDQFSKSIHISCQPTNQPCLHYMINISPPSSDTIAQVDMTGDGARDGGPFSQTGWSSNCTRVGDTQANCKIGESVNGNFSQVSSGRSVSVTFENLASAAQIAGKPHEEGTSADRMCRCDGHIIITNETDLDCAEICEQ
ncbi:MAG: hypothetical protein ABL958_07935 [Bdellovibrionia bacterium]